MIDRALESVSAPYKLAIRILLFFLMSSVAQLEAEIQKGPENLKIIFLKIHQSKTNIGRIFSLAYLDLADQKP